MLPCSDFFKFRNSEAQLSRWLEKLQCYDFKIAHSPGHMHVKADALLMQPCCKPCPKKESKELVAQRNGCDSLPLIHRSAHVSDSSTEPWGEVAGMDQEQFKTS